MKKSDKGEKRKGINLSIPLVAFFACVAFFAFPQKALPQVNGSTSTFTNGSVFAGLERTLGLGREEYRYIVEWGPLKVGKASLGSLETVEVASTTAYKIFSGVRTLPFFDAFYKVRDRNEAWLDTKTFLSLGFAKRLREGRFRRNEEVFYDHEAGAFRAKVYKRNGTVINESGSMKPYAYDVLSALYWVRAQNLEPGRSFVINVNTRRDWPLNVKVVRTERAKVPAGEFECFVLEPELADEGIFIQKGKSMTIWLTTDVRRLPIRIKAEVFIGSVKAELEEIVYKE